MPSQSLLKFESNLLVDVDRLIESHAQLNHDGGGKRGLGHITRSGVLMLCAAWELYLEELAIEAANYLSGRVSRPLELPKPVKKELARAVKEAKNHLKPLELAGEGWKDVYGEHVRLLAQSLNTPKAARVDALFSVTTGFESISALHLPRSRPS